MRLGHIARRPFGINGIHVRRIIRSSDKQQPVRHHRVGNVRVSLIRHPPQMPPVRRRKSINRPRTRTHHLPNPVNFENSRGGKSKFLFLRGFWAFPLPEDLARRCIQSGHKRVALRIRTENEPPFDKHGRSAIAVPRRIGQLPVFPDFRPITHTQTSRPLMAKMHIHPAVIRQHWRGRRMPVLLVNRVRRRRPVLLENFHIPERPACLQIKAQRAQRTIRLRVSFFAPIRNDRRCHINPAVAMHRR